MGSCYIAHRLPRSRKKCIELVNFFWRISEGDLVDRLIFADVRDRRANKDRASTLLFKKLVCNIEEFDVGQSCVSGNKSRESVQAYGMPEFGSLEVSRRPGL